MRNNKQWDFDPGKEIASLPSRKDTRMYDPVCMARYTQQAYTLKQVAGMLHIGEELIEKDARSGKLKSYRHAQTPMFLPEHIEEYRMTYLYDKFPAYE